MDKRKEKYINYVVVDLISNTEIDYDQKKIKYPFLSPFSLRSTRLLPHSLLFSLPPFSKYVIERYGIHDNDVDNTWEIYKGKIKEVIDNG